STGAVRCGLRYGCEGTDATARGCAAVPVESTLLQTHGARVRPALARVVQRQPAERFLPPAFPSHDQRAGRVLAGGLLGDGRRGTAAGRLSRRSPEHASG